MKIFARRIEAPTPDRPYATKWQVVVRRNPDSPNEYFDRLCVSEGAVVFEMNEDENPAIWAYPVGAKVEGLRGAVWTVLVDERRAK